MQRIAGMKSPPKGGLFTWGTGRQRPVPSAEGEIFLGHLHQVVGAGQHGGDVGAGTRQDALEVEARGLQLAL